MPKLVSMKIDKSAREARAKSMIEPESDGPAYPWGLSLNLDDEVLEKLGIDLPDVGKSLMLVARVDVTAVSSNESKGGGKNRSASLQITDLAIETDTGEGASAADKLYAKG